jgi:hypothetical protein
MQVEPPPSCAHQIYLASLQPQLINNRNLIDIHTARSISPKLLSSSSTSLSTFNHRLAPASTAATMRLTAELITNSLSYINPLLERELDLRGV